MKNLAKFFSRKAEESLCVYSNIQVICASPGWCWRGEVILSVVAGKYERNVYTHISYSKVFPSNDIDGEYKPLVDSEYKRICEELTLEEEECQMKINLGEYNYLLN